MKSDNTKIIEEFEYFDDKTKKYFKIPKGLKHILVFGQSRQGKSSIINMITGKNKMTGAEVSPDIIGCTCSTKPWINHEYCFWDTTGLNENDKGLVINTDSIKALIKFVRNSKGFHGAMMVVSHNNLNSSNTERNWKLFYDNFLDQRVPMIICITGRGMESSDNDIEWLYDQNDLLKKYGYLGNNGNGYTCVVYSKDFSEIMESYRNQYTQLRLNSIKFLNSILAKNINHIFYNPIEELGVEETFKKIWNTLMNLFGWKSMMYSIRDSFLYLLKKIGFPQSEAEEICKEFYFDN